MPGASERGTIAPLALTAVLLLFAVLAFSVDQGIACAAKVRQENAVDAARDACFDASFALMAKNADDPGLAVARRIAESLRSAGFSGAATVWFFEVPKEDLLASRRVWGVAVQLQEQAPTVFARGFGIESLPVASKRVLVAEPFAGSVVWRPDRSGGEVFELASGAEPTALARRGFDRLDDGPAELEREVRAAVAAAGGPAERKGP
ncbi:MAG: hypothetical protein KH015_06025 [Gordonibacter pamelaeae]|uniref:Uncharacterized protein n=2 Tax=Gordonibacter pamelaeae TaxID=471189 RepID=A0A369M7I5_9ACTN|nr:hypothetical protein [Gordonibacter pamelaeae]RDB67364.1 hypothetical protein C1877_02230 [Gordonibacter pamelaeae]